MTAKEIIKLLGGRSLVVDMLNSTVGRVNSWCARNYIPDWWRDTLLEIAAKQGKPLTADDFPVKGDGE